MLDAVDLCIVGGGISGTLTLIHYLGDQHMRDSAITGGRKTHIAMFDDYGDFGGGVAYGRRSGATSLLISSFKTSVPPDCYAELLDYVNDTYDTWTARLQGEEVSSLWIKANAQKLAAREFDDLAMPRFLLADFVHFRLMQAIQESTAFATVHLVIAEVQSIARTADGFSVKVADAQGLHEVAARAVLLAVGLAPPASPDGLTAADGYIHNLYSPSLDENLERIARHPTFGEKKMRIAVYGSNAGALDLMYQLSRIVRLRDKIAAIFVISPSGRWPDSWNDSAEATSRKFPILDGLRNGAAKIDAHGIADALFAEVEGLVAAGVSPRPYVEVLLSAALAMLQQLDFAQCIIFFEEYTYPILRTLASGTGDDCLEAAYELERAGISQRIAGRVLKTTSRPNGGLRVEYSLKNASQTVFVDVDVAVHCAGYSGIGKTISPLLRQIFADSTLGVRMNASQRGIPVDEQFQAAAGIFVLGPLLQGLCNSRIAIFDVENTGRLWLLSILVSEEIRRFLDKKTVARG